MNRLSHLGISIALGAFVLFWCFFGVVMYIGYGAFGFGADAYVVLWAVIFLGSVWLTFSSFRRAFKPPLKRTGDSCPQTEAGAPASERKSPPQSGDFNIERANEKLAALLQKPKE